MSLYRALDQRLRSESYGQLLAVLLFLIVITLVFSWTASPLQSNDSWFNVTAVRRFALALLAVGLAVGSSGTSAAGQLAGLLTLLVTGLVTIPFELLTFAASYPAASLAGSLYFDLIFPCALYGLVLLAARLFPTRSWLAVLFVPPLIGLCFAIDELVGIPLLNPVIIVTNDDWPLLLTWTALAIAGISVLVSRWRRER